MLGERRQMDLRLLLISFLSIVLWELLKFAIGRSVGIVYYRRESDTVVIKMRLMPWDKKGRRHFEQQGYQRTFPELPTTPRRRP
jgi:hypothetical protein